MNVADSEWELPNGANPCFSPPMRICPGNKLKMGKGITGKERAEFGGICRIGPNQIILCYGYGYRDIEYSRNDFMYMCNDCIYSFNIKNGDGYMKNIISEPYFIEYKYSDLIDIESNNPKYFVYFISDGSYVKIGISNNMKKRMAHLQIGNPKRLECLFLIPVKGEKEAMKLESALHLVYREYRMVGEWFDILGYLRIEDFRIYFDAKRWSDVTSLGRDERRAYNG